MNDSDLIWLQAQRSVHVLDPELTEGTRASMLADAHPAPARRRRRRAPSVRLLALAGVAAAAIVAGVLGTSSGTGSDAGSAAVASHPHIGVLQLLANRIKAAPKLPGDATLIVRHQAYPDRSAIDGADLYADDGSYYYAPTVAGLAGAIKSSPVSTGAGQREAAAAIAALHAADPATVREQMAIAGFDPNEASQMSANLTPVLVDGYVWDNSMEALNGGAANPDVRAGVLRLLGVIPEVAVSHVTLDNRPAVALTARLWNNTYSERLVIDATTGMPRQFVGGFQGKTPDVTISYTVSRVTLSQLTHP